MQTSGMQTLWAACKCLQILAWRPLASHQRPRQEFKWAESRSFNILYWKVSYTTVYILYLVSYIVVFYVTMQCGNFWNGTSYEQV